MRCLLDTCVFIWLDQDPARLGAAAAAVLQDPAHTLLVSYISLWEIQTKLSKGKLSLSGTLEQVIRDQIQQNNVGLLPLKLDHIIELAKIPRLHPDGVDRLLVAQARFENLTIITPDAAFPPYGVPVVW